MLLRQQLIKRSKKAKRESKILDFKEGIDVNSKAEWCEVLKDIIAIANSGGGIIVFGVQDNGKKSKISIDGILDYDLAKLTDKIYRYTSSQFSDFEIVKIRRHNYYVAGLIIGSSFPPLIFSRPGTYEIPGGKQKRAFSQGVIYFRHGSKSEPSVSNDIEKIIEREINKRRKAWLGNIRKLIDAPADHKVHIFPPHFKLSTDDNATPIRLTADPNATSVKINNPDEIFKFRLKDVIKIVNEKLPKSHKKINNYDIQAVCFHHHLKDKLNFAHQPLYSSFQYSEEFINYLVKRIKTDKNFISDSRKVYYNSRYKK